MSRARSGSVEWHGSKWIARVTCPDGSRPRLPIPGCNWPHTDEGRAIAATMAVEVVKAHLDDPRVTAGRPKPPGTVHELFAAWVALLSLDPGNLRSATSYDYVSRVRANVLPAFGNMKAPISVQTLRSFFRTMKATKEPGTVRNTANALTKFFEACRAEGWVAGDNPMHNRDVRAVLPELKTVDPEAIVVLFDAQVRALLNCAQIPQERRDLYLMAICTGMRDGEIRGLTRANVSLGGTIPTIRVTEQLVYPRGPGSGAVAGPLKSAWSRRTIPVHPMLAEVLERRGAGLEPGEFVFGDGTRPDSAGMLRADLELAGLPVEVNGRPITFHCLRHTFASLLGASDVAGETIDRLLGHAPSTTRGRHYQAPSLEGAHRAICKLDLGTVPEPTKLRIVA